MQPPTHFFFKCILEEYVYVLNLTTSRDVSQNSFEDIIELCMKYSRRKEKAGKGVRATKSTRSITRTKLGNLLENFKQISWKQSLHRLIQ